jgi:hypothetical protein
MAEVPPRIAGPVAYPKAPREQPPPGSWDTHAHIFGPPDKFPYTAGRGYTPPDAPVENFIALLDRLGAPLPLPPHRSPITLHRPCPSRQLPLARLFDPKRRVVAGERRRDLESAAPLRLRLNQ